MYIELEHYKNHILDGFRTEMRRFFGQDLLPPLHI